jgi:hypothetical protein
MATLATGKGDIRANAESAPGETSAPPMGDIDASLGRHSRPAGESSFEPGCEAWGATARDEIDLGGR